jgi:hypothetical protein
MGNPGNRSWHIGREQQGLWSPRRTLKIGRRNFLGQTGAMAAVGLATLFPGQALATSPHRPSTSRASREEAIRAIPLTSLNDPLRTKIEAVISSPTVYRRMPVAVISCDPELYVFLVRYPEVIVNMWQLMGVTRVKLKRQGAYAFDAEDGAGTTAKVELVFGTREKHLVLAEGAYEGPMLPRRVSGRCVLLLSSGYSQNRDGRPYISSRLDAFVQLDNVGVELVAKVLHPLMGRTADTNFVESTKFLSQVSHAVETNGEGIQRLATQLDGIQPQIKDQFAELAAKINHRSVVREMVAEQASANGRVPNAGSNQSIDNRIEIR